MNWLKIKLWSCVAFCLAVIVFLIAKPIHLSGTSKGRRFIFSPSLFKHFKFAQAYLILLLVLFIVAFVILALWTYRITFHKDGKKILKILNVEFKDSDIKQFGFAILILFLTTLLLIKVNYSYEGIIKIKFSVLSPFYYAMLGAAGLLFIILMIGTKFKPNNPLSDVENYLNSKD